MAQPTIDELINQKPKNRAEAQKIISDINKRIAELQAVRPTTTSSGVRQYLVEGVNLTQNGFNARIKNLRDRATFVNSNYIEGNSFGVVEQNRANQLYPRYETMRADIRSDLAILKEASKKAKTISEKENLEAWIKVTEAKLREFNQFLPQLSSGFVPTELPKDYVSISINDAKKSLPPSVAQAAQVSQAAQQSVNTSSVKTKDEARTRIQQARSRLNALKGIVGERQANGQILYFEAAGMPGMSKGQLDRIIATEEAIISELNKKFFAETAAPGAQGGQPAATQPATTQPTGATSGGFVPGPGQSVFGGTTIQPGTMLPAGGTPGAAGGVDLSGVNFPETPADTTVDLSGVNFPAPETPARDTTAPIPGSDVTVGAGANTPGAAPAGQVTGPSYTEPATGVTYQPGEQIGGEDRALPNGGAVVDGIYIPPGIDYTWLGQQVPQDWEDAAKELYGAYYEMIKQYPELGTLIKNRIEQGWSNDRFDYELRQTNWWKTTNENSRAWEELKITDPATAQTQLDNRTALIRDTAQRLGITLSGESLAKIAENSIKLGLDLTSQLEDIVGSEARLSAGGMSQLRFGYVGNSIRESARKYGVALSDVTFNEWVNKIAVGAESQETFESYAQQIARTLYPTLAGGFDRGLSFGQMTDPYAQVASRILEIPATQVDFTDPKWAQAFMKKNDKGEQMQMSFGEWSDYLRTNSAFGYEYTDDAVSKAYNVANDLAKAFGRA